MNRSPLRSLNQSTHSTSAKKAKNDNISEALTAFKYELEKLQTFKSEKDQVFQLEEGRKIIRQYKDNMKRTLTKFFKQFEEDYERQVTEYSEALQYNIDELERRLELVVENLERTQQSLTSSTNDVARVNARRVADIDFEYELKGYNSLVTELMKNKLEIIIDKGPLEDISERLSRYIRLSSNDDESVPVQPTGVIEKLYGNSLDVNNTSMHWKQSPTTSHIMDDSSISPQLFSKLKPVNDHEITAPNFFDEACRSKYLHFFEGNTKILHLLDLDTVQKTEEPVFKQVELNIQFKIPTRHRSIITPQGKIFLTGGVDQNRTTHATLKYNEEGRTLEMRSFMVYPRKSHGICYLDGYIYCVGGFTDLEGFTNHCERYDILADKWEVISPMHHKASSPSVCSFGKYSLYRFGGLLTVAQLTESIEKYDVRENKWTLYEIGSQMSGFKLYWLSASCQLNRSQILVCGGCDENDRPASQTFLFEVGESGGKQSRATFKIKKVDPNGLPKPGGFWNSQMIIHSKIAYFLQNYISSPTKTVAEEYRRTVLKFGAGRNWDVLS